MRPAKLIGNLFVLAALSLIFLVYYVYVGLIMGPKLMGKLENSPSFLKTNSLNRQSPGNSELDSFPRAVHLFDLVLLPGDDHRPWTSASLLGKLYDL